MSMLLSVALFGALGSSLQTPSIFYVGWSQERYIPISPQTAVSHARPAPDLQKNADEILALFHPDVGRKVARWDVRFAFGYKERWVFVNADGSAGVVSKEGSDLTYGLFDIAQLELLRRNLALQGRWPAAWAENRVQRITLIELAVIRNDSDRTFGIRDTLREVASVRPHSQGLVILHWKQDYVLLLDGAVCARYGPTRVKEWPFTLVPVVSGPARIEATRFPGGKEETVESSFRPILKAPRNDTALFDSVVWIDVSALD